MSLEFSCPHCSATLEVDESMVGTVIRCGGCSTLLRVPSTPYGIAERVREDSEQLSPSSGSSEGSSSPAESTPIAPAAGVPPRQQRPRSPNVPWPPPPVASPGRGVVFWILMVIGGLIVGSCLCCIGIFIVLPEPEWQTHTSRDGWFQVDFPAPPRPQLGRPSFLPPDADPTVEGANLDKYGEEYRVISWQVQPLQRLVRTDEALMQRALEELQKQLRNHQIIQGPRPVPGQPHLTYELQWLDKGNHLHIARLVLAGERFYLLYVRGRNFWMEPDSERMERFFQSFRVLRLRARDPMPQNMPGPLVPMQKDNNRKK